MTNDLEIEGIIEALESERERLLADESEEAPENRHANRLETIRVELDRLWDLKRQRQALRDAGENPDEAQERPAGEVEGYLQ
jgi:Protein of unknown function (DUF2630)